MPVLDFDFYFITDSALSKRGNSADVRAALSAGVKMVQYREKCANGKKMLAEALEIKKMCDESRATLIINDNIALCLAADASGVHLGQDDVPLRIARTLLPKKIIGVTVHNLQEALQAEREGADYLGVSPIFPTRTKSDAGKPCGTGILRKIRAETSLPLSAIGGITLKNLTEVIGAGADGVSAISATVGTDDVRAAVADFRSRILKARK
ncbi:MAG: thiamine phosphate synthase [Candidatus Diapherotrites archaeon]